MRKLALIVAAFGALALAAPASAADGSTGALQVQQTSQGGQAVDEISAQRRHWRGHRHRHHWHGHRHWRPHYYGPRCRTVWNAYRGRWVRVCRW